MQEGLEMSTRVRRGEGPNCKVRLPLQRVFRNGGVAGVLGILRRIPLSCLSSLLSRDFFPEPKMQMSLFTFNFLLIQDCGRGYRGC